MCEPLSIAVGSAALGRLCVQLTLFISETWKVDRVTDVLRQEIDGLSTVLTEISKSFCDPEKSANSLRSGQQHWQNVERLITQCQGTLTSLDSHLRTLPNSQGTSRFFQRPWKKLKLELKSGEITLFQQQIAFYRRTIGMSLQMITISSVIASETHGENISAKLNVLITQIQQLSQAIRHPLEPHAPISEMTYVEDNFRVMNTVQDCIRSAEQFATDTQSTVAESERSVSARLSAIAENVPPPTRRPVDTGSTSPASERIRDWIVEPVPPEDASTVQQESTILTEGTLIDDDDPDDLEYSLIRNWRGYATRDMKLADYAQAEIRLQKILSRSQAKYGDQYHWKEETLALLASAYRHQSKWDLAEEILERFLADRIAAERNQDALDINHELAELYLAKGDLDNAELHGVQAVNGRKRSLGKENDLFYESTKLLIGIYEAKGDTMEADGYRPLLPADHLSKECEEIKQLSSMRPQDAAVHIGVDLLKDLLPDECLWKWDEIRVNIMLCRDGIMGSGSGYTLLHAIAEFGNELSLLLLLSKGADVNAVDLAGNTPLHLAAKSRQRIVQLLLDNGAEIEAQANDGRTALMNAAKSCQPDIVSLFLRKSAKVETKDSLEWSALHYAAFSGSETVVMMLLERGADLEMRGGYGRTPLHCAASRGRERVVQLLVQKGANVRLKSRDGLTALDLARKQAHQSIVLYLQCQSQKIKLKIGRSGIGIESGKRKGFTLGR